MRRDIVWFVMICLLNVLICVVYLLWNLVWKQFSDEEKEKEPGKKEQRTKEQSIKEQKIKEQKRKEQLRKGAPEYIM